MWYLYFATLIAESLYTKPDLLGMWYLYFAVGLAAVCLGIPLYLVYRTDKRRADQNADRRRGKQKKR